VKNKELAHIFNRLADGLELQGANRFRVLAYRKASRVLDELTEDVAVLLEKKSLSSVPGIGKALAEKIKEYLETGKIRKYEEIKKEISGDLLNLLDIQNLGPKTLRNIHRELGVKDLNGLKRVIDNGAMAKLPQMGEKKVANIKKGIAYYEQSMKRMGLDRAEQTACEIIEYLRKETAAHHLTSAGSLRRCQETIGDIDILATAEKGQSIIKIFTKFPKTTSILAAGATKGSIIVQGNIQVDLRIVKPASYGAALQYFTGSKEHNVKIRNIAKTRGMKLSEYGLFRGRKQTAGKTEKQIYQKLGMAYIEPEMREDRGEIELAQKHRLPRLVKINDIRGDLQMHSIYSDSQASIEELAEAAVILGYEYILITDHSVSARYAHGLNTARLHKQWKEIDRINKRKKNIHILKGAEVDILADGHLDYPDKILKQLDLVLASIHQGFKKNVTKRICTAMENPYVDILAHPTGRLISQRAGYDIDLAAVMEKARQTRTWLELNAYPDRLDLNDINLRRARDKDIKISIGTDAHSVDGLAWMKFGVATARRGWLRKSDIVNTYSLKVLLDARKRCLS
jgi:DNA polymerase (family 10)